LANHRAVVIVSENLAKEYWHDPASALGKQIRIGNTDDWREMIGVAKDVHNDGPDNPAPASVYWPVLQDVSRATRRCSVAMSRS